MYQQLLEDSRFFDLLLQIDEDFADETRRKGCACGGVLHCADYDRKPRGGPVGLTGEIARRFSFCCAEEGCRRRTTPVSLRFLGRKVFFGAVVLLVSALRDGPSPKRLDRLCASFRVSVRTVRRWRRFWKETFVASRIWRAIAGNLLSPVAAGNLPLGLLEVFGGIADVGERVVAVLRQVSPIGQSRAF